MWGEHQLFQPQFWLLHSEIAKMRLQKAAFLHLRWKWVSALPAHLSNFCNSQGRAMSAIFGGFISTNKGLTQLHSTLALTPRKQVEIWYKGIGLPGQWLGNSQKELCMDSRHSHIPQTCHRSSVRSNLARGAQQSHCAARAAAGPRTAPGSSGAPHLSLDELPWAGEPHNECPSTRFM